jgi:hypothetical protein|eukprot:COSAG01_NODE_1946_length_8829_cov_909.234937_8_plen_172_part_00
MQSVCSRGCALLWCAVCACTSVGTSSSVFGPAAGLRCTARVPGCGHNTATATVHLASRGCSLRGATQLSGSQELPWHFRQFAPVYLDWHNAPKARRVSASKIHGHLARGTAAHTRSPPAWAQRVRRPKATPCLSSLSPCSPTVPLHALRQRLCVVAILGARWWGWYHLDRR